MERKEFAVAGGPDTPPSGAGGSPVFEPLNRGLFRQSALAHYERWGGDPGGAGRPGDGGLPKRWWRVVLAAGLVCLTALGTYAVLAQVPVFATVPVLVAAAEGAGPGRVVAVFPQSAAEWVRRGTTVRVPAAQGTVSVAVSGDGPVLTARQMVEAFPELAGAAGLPARGVLARGVLARGTAQPVPAGPGAGGGPVVVTATGYVGDRPLIERVGSSSPAAGS